MSHASRTTGLPRDVGALAGLFAASGMLRVVRPQVYQPSLPSRLPARRGVVVVSGAAELLCAAGLLLPATRRPAGRASAALLAALFPGTVATVLEGARTRSAPLQLAGLARLPVQLPLIRAALRASQGASQGAAQARGPAVRG